MAEVLWQLEGVTLRGDDRARLHDVSCAIHRGVTLVLGPSGAGKTSLLELLVGYSRPTAGRIEAEGSCYWMPSDFGLWSHVTVRAHLDLVQPAARATTPGSDTLLTQLDLASVADRRPSALSTGQQSRVALARALATGATTLVLDEPFAHLGDAHAQACANLLAHAVQEGRSLVVATHAPARLEGLATASLALDEGRLARSPAPLRRALLPLVCACAALFASCTENGAHAARATMRRTIALPSTEARAPAPRAVAPGADDTWLVLDDAGRVLVFGADGDLQRQWAMPEHAAGNPEGIHRLADGRIVVADTHYHRLVFFTADGSVQQTLGSRGDGPGQFRYPVSVVQADDGALFVAEYGGNDRVQKFTPAGVCLGAFGRFGAGPNELQRPAGLACRGDHLYVADAMNGRVQVFTLDGAHVRSLPEHADLACPYDVALGADGSLLVVEYGGGCLTELGADGARRTRYGRPGRGRDELATPWSVGVRGRVAMIADTGNRRLVQVQW